MKQGGEPSGGFTVIETLIVLAVSTLLAISALLLINGRQNKAEFQTATNDLKQQLQQVLNESQNGYFPNSGEVSCSGNNAGVGGGPFLQKVAGTQQGTNSGCIFLGKVIQLGTTQNPDKLVVFSVVGNQHDAAGVSTQNLSTAFPTAIAPTTAHVDYPDLTASHALEYGLAPSTASSRNGFRDSTASSPWGAGVGQLGVLAGDSIGNVTSSSSGSQDFSLYIVKTTGLNTSQAAAAGQITYTNLKSVTGATLCVNSGTTGQSAMYTIGSSDSGGFGVTVQVYDKADCV